MERALTCSAVHYIMSRQRKPPSSERTPSAPIQAPRPAAQPIAQAQSTSIHQAENQSVAELMQLRQEIAELRQEVNTRLDLMLEVIERQVAQAEKPALPPVSRTVPPATVAGSPPPRPVVTPAVTPSTRPATPARPVRTMILPSGAVISEGEEVYLPRLDKMLFVKEITADGENVTLISGQMRIRAQPDEIWSLNEVRGSGIKHVSGKRQQPDRPALNLRIAEIDLHGYTEEQALITLELFLHHEYSRRTARVRVIHGKGNGILRAAVRKALGASTLVRRVDAGPHFHGEDGVTLAELDI